MDKRAALEIYLKVHDECMQHEMCKGCAFSEPLNGEKVCILDYITIDAIGMSVRAKLKDMEGKQEEHSVPPKN